MTPGAPAAGSPGRGSAGSRNQPRWRSLIKVSPLVAAGSQRAEPRPGGYLRADCPDRHRHLYLARHRCHPSGKSFMRQPNLQTCSTQQIREVGGRVPDLYEPAAPSDMASRIPASSPSRGDRRGGKPPGPSGGMVTSCARPRGFDGRPGRVRSGFLFCVGQPVSRRARGRPSGTAPGSSHRGGSSRKPGGSRQRPTMGCPGPAARGTASCRV